MIREIIELRRILRNRRLSAPELEGLRAQRLKAVVRNAYEHVPYYRTLMKSAGVSPEEIRTPEDLQRIPVTHKEDLKAAGLDNITADWADLSRYVKSATSGSTGEPFAVYRTKREETTRLQFQMAALLAAGFLPRDRFVMLIHQWNAPWRMHAALGLYRRWVVLVTLPPEEQIRRLRQLKPTILWTSPSALRALIHNSGNRLREVINPRILILNGEVYDGLLKQQVESQLDTEVFNFYGACEFGRIAWECTTHEGLHINNDHLIVESLTGDKPAGFGKTGTTVITSLYSFAMPLIRYNINDLSVLSEHGCSCGSPLPLMEHPMGRDLDLLALPNGKHVNVHEWMDTVPRFRQIHQFRIIQESVDSALVELVPWDRIDDGTLKRIRDDLEAYVDRAVRVRVQTVDFIAPEGSKFRTFISRVAPKPRLAGLSATDSGHAGRESEREST